MTFKFIHKISVIQEKLLVLLNLLRGPDTTRSGAGSSPWFVHPWFKPSHEDAVMAMKVLATLAWSQGRI